MKNLEIGRTIRMIRQAKAMKLGQLAGKAKVSVAFLSLIESGDRQPSLSVLRRIAHVLRVPSEVLIVLSQPTGGALRAPAKRSRALTAAILKLAEAEESLRSFLARDDATGEER